MRLWVSTLLLLGCQLAWDPESYRGDDGLDAAVDASDDAHDAGEILDVGVDTGTDAGTDTGLIVRVDGGPDRDAGERCDLEMATGALTYSVDGATLENTRLFHHGTGPAVRITASDVTIRNVEIVVTQAGGWGIELESGADNVSIDDVRVVTDVEMRTGPFANRFALAARSDGSLIGGLRVSRLETVGMEGIFLDGVRDARLSIVRIRGARGVGVTSTIDAVHAGIRMVDTIDSSVRDFEVTGPNPHLSHAILLVNNQGLSLSDGFSSVDVSRRFAVRVEGNVVSPSPRNTIERLQISESFAGIDLDATRDWLVQNSKVVRRDDCIAGDYAYANRGSGNNVTCTNCESGGSCTAGAGLALTVVSADAFVGAAEPITFCFGVTF